MYGYPLYHTTAAAGPSGRPTVEVLGEAWAAAAPDRAIVVLGAVTENKALQEAQSENAAITARILQSLQSLSIPKENIQTTDYRIEVQYDYVEGKQVFRGYKVTHLLEITVEHPERTGTVVDTAVSHGANTVTSIRFSVARPELFENRALSLAIANARQKAATVAASLGISLSPAPFKIQELSRSSESPVFKTALLAAAPATPIQPGELKIYSSVRVWYLLA